eukprot:2111463-Rhodomonas_salina.1
MAIWPPREDNVAQGNTPKSNTRNRLAGTDCTAIAVSCLGFRVSMALPRERKRARRMAMWPSSEKEKESGCTMMAIRPWNFRGGAAPPSSANAALPTRGCHTGT